MLFINQPERVLAGRPGPNFDAGDYRYEYLVKWTDQPYSASTWDYEEDINAFIFWLFIFYTLF